MSKVREKRDIEWLVNWALEKQGLGRSAFVGGGEGGVANWMTLGTRVDGGGAGGGMGGKWVHEDAQHIADTINAMSRDARIAAAVALVVQYGRAGIQPDWGEAGCGRYELVRKNNGEGKAIRRYADQRQARDLLGFEWEWVGHNLESLDFMMIQWLAWHSALTELRDLLNTKMRTYEATGPRWPEAPWDTPERVVHSVSAAS